MVSISPKISGVLMITCMIAFSIQRWVNSKVKERYIDEYFHLSMTEHYTVHGNFSHWDPKITTPPGLYLLGLIFGYGLTVLNGLFS